MEVGLTEPVCPWCGQPLEEEGVESASTTDDPTPPATDRAVLSGPCVSVPVVRQAGARSPIPHLAPDQYGATAHRVGPRVMATAHVLHYGVGIPSARCRRCSGP